MSWSRCSCSAIDITTALIEMISLTMSRISSRAEFGIELGELGQIDGVDQRVEDRRLDLVVVLRARIGACARRRACDDGHRRRGSRLRRLRRGRLGRRRFGGRRRRLGTERPVPRRCGRAGARCAAGAGSRRGKSEVAERFPNIYQARLRPVRKERKGSAPLSAPATGLRPVRSSRQGANRLRRSASAAGPPSASGRCWRRRRTSAGSNGITSDGGTPMVSAKSLTGISGRLETPTWLSTSFGRGIVGPVLLQQIDDRLAVAQAGQIGRGHDHDIVGGQQASDAPRAPTHGADRARRRASSGAPPRSRTHRPPASAS